MFSLVLIGVLVLAFFGAIIASFVVDEYDRVIPRAIAVVSIIAALVVAGISSTTIVSARSVGIETTLGKYTRTLDNGFHWKSPLAKVEEFPTTAQYLDAQAPITFAGGGSGTQSLTVRWTIRADEAGALWEKYRSFENVRDQLVQPTVKDATRAVFANYSPVDARSGDNVRKISELITTDLTHTLADSGINIDSISLTGTGLDDSAQQSLNRVTEAQSNIERAKADYERAKIDAKTDAERNKNVTDENLVLKCLEITNNWNTQANGTLPATWNCLGAESAGVLVDAKG